MNDQPPTYLPARVIPSASEGSLSWSKYLARKNALEQMGDPSSQNAFGAQDDMARKDIALLVATMDSMIFGSENDVIVQTEMSGWHNWENLLRPCRGLELFILRQLVVGTTG
jgi:hypothetical protein